jgi:hypothetical protein
VVPDEGRCTSPTTEGPTSQEDSSEGSPGRSNNPICRNAPPATGLVTFNAPARNNRWLLWKPKPTPVNTPSNVYWVISMRAPMVTLVEIGSEKSRFQ